MSSALDASPLTCSKCAAARFRDLWKLRFEKTVALLFDSEILLERCCFLSELFLFKARFSSCYAEEACKKGKDSKIQENGYLIGTLLRITCPFGKWENH